jgi:preprotein translocase subunit SecA
VLDRKWREHLYEMDYLQEGIGLRAMGQRDPLVEYQREGFDMFAAMMEAIKEESVGFLFNVEVQVEEQPPPQGDLVATGPGEVGGETMEAHLLPGAEPTPEHERPAIPAAPAVTADTPPPFFARPTQPEHPAAPQEPPAPEQSAPEQPRVDEAPAAMPESVAVVDAPAPVVPPAQPAEPVPAAAAEPAAPGAPGAAAAPTGAVIPEGFGRPDRPAQLQYSAPNAEGGVTTSGTVDPLTGQVSTGGPSRNAPCPCGSGKKYKRCHGDPRNQGS